MKFFDCVTAPSPRRVRFNAGQRSNGKKRRLAEQTVASLSISKL